MGPNQTQVFAQQRKPSMKHKDNLQNGRKFHLQWKEPKHQQMTGIRRCSIYTMEYYSAIKKNEIMPFAATWIQLEITILNEISQKEKDKYHMISLICGI